MSDFEFSTAGGALAVSALALLVSIYTLAIAVPKDRPFAFPPKHGFCR